MSDTNALLSQLLERIGALEARSSSTGALTPTTSAAPTEVGDPADDEPRWGTPVPGLMHKPGYCYLALFRDEDHGRVSFDVGPYPSGALLRSKWPELLAHGHTGRFRLTFGERSSVQASQKFQCHVERVSAGLSLLRAKDVVLELVPDHARYGESDKLAEALVPAPAMQPATPAVHPALGRIPDPLIRPRTFVLGTLKMGKADQLPGAFIAHFDPGAHAVVRDALVGAHFAKWDELKVTLSPHSAATAAKCVVDFVFFPASETAPDGLEAIQRCSQHHRAVLQSPTPGGACNSHTFTCLEAHGVSHIFKPAPFFGGSPKIAIRINVEGLFQMAPPDGSVLFDVVVSGVINMHPPF